MARKTIFAQLSEQIDYRNEMLRIDELMKTKQGIRIEIYEELSFQKPKQISNSIEEFVDSFSFKNWKNRHRCIDCADMRKALGLSHYFSKATIYDPSEEAFLSYLEYAANILYLVDLVRLKENCKYEKMSAYHAIEENIESCLNWVNFETKEFKTQQKVLVVQKNAATTAVAEIVEENLAFEIVQYNHFLLKGDIETKKKILIKLGNNLEPRREELKSINKNLEDSIFFMLNNMDLRHNNRSKKDKNYKEYVAKMKKKNLEEWYDELYQMILLAYLELDQVNRFDRVKQLKSSVSGLTR